MFLCCQCEGPGGTNLEHVDQCAPEMEPIEDGGVAVNISSPKKITKSELEKLVKTFTKKAAAGLSCEWVDGTKVQLATFKLDPGKLVGNITVEGQSEPEVVIELKEVSDVHGGNADVAESGATMVSLTTDQRERMVAFAVREAPMARILLPSANEQGEALKCFKVLCVYAQSVARTPRGTPRSTQ